MNEEKTPAVSALRQRMIEDMTARRLCEKTQTAHIRAVRRLAKFLGRVPDAVNGDELRRFQLHLVQIGLSPISINATVYGVRFFLENTLDRPELVRKLRLVRVEQRLPVILSRDEVTRLIESARGIKYQTALSVAYGAGLRAGEVVSLKSTDVDSERMVVRGEPVGLYQIDEYLWRLYFSMVPLGILDSRTMRISRIKRHGSNRRQGARGAAPPAPPAG